MGVSNMKKEASNLLRKSLWYFLVLALTVSCGSDDEKDATQHHLNRRRSKSQLIQR